MGAPCVDACKMPLVEIARPPRDIGRLACEVNRVLAGAAASLQHVSRFPGKARPQDGPYRLTVAMECRSVQSAVRLDRPLVPAEFRYVIRHQRLQSRARGNLHPFLGCDNILALCRNGYTLHCLPLGFMLLEQRYFTFGNNLVANPRLNPVCLLALALTIGAAASPVRAQTGAAEGQKLAFDRGKGNCLTCHVIKGGDLAGTIGPPLQDIRTKYPNRSDLVAILTDESRRNPQTLMPPFGRNRILTEQEINAIVDFLQTL